MNRTTPVSQGSKMRMLIWGISSLFLWRVLFLLPAVILPPQFQIHAFIGGCILATGVLFWTQTMLFPDLQGVEETAVTGPIIICALLIATGVAIVAKDLGNMGLALSGDAVTPIAAPKAEISPFLVAILSSVVYPIAYSLVLVGILARCLFRHLPVYQAITLAVFITLIGAPFYAWPRLAALACLPIWLFHRTHSLPLAVVSYLPATILPLLNALGLGPNIPGFDVEDPQRIILQPLWFNLVGLFLILVGITIMNQRQEPRVTGQPK